MYTRLSHKRTKKYYREIVDLAIEETQKLLEISPEIAMYRSILNQLIDIKHTIIEQCKVFAVMDLYRKYSLGLIAVKNFDEATDEYAQKLIDSYGGAFDYYDMIEE